MVELDLIPKKILDWVFSHLGQEQTFFTLGTLSDHEMSHPIFNLIVLIAHFLGGKINVFLKFLCYQYFLPGYHSQQ